MGKSCDGINQPKAFLHSLSWATSRWHIWCPDLYAWWPQLPSSGWHRPASSQGYDRWYRGGMRWCWDVAPKSKNLPNDDNRLPKFKRKLQRRIIRQQQYLQVIRNHALDLFADYKQSVVAEKNVTWLHMKWSHCESSFWGLFGQYEAYKQPPSCK